MQLTEIGTTISVPATTMVLSSTPAEQHTAALEEYAALYGFGAPTGPISKSTFETVMLRANQIMTDKGILTGTNATTETETTMTLYSGMGLFNSSNNLKTRAEVFAVLLDQIHNSTIKAAHVNIINYTGSDYIAYTTNQLDELLESSALNASEKNMISGAKDIFIASATYWDNHPVDALNGKYQGIMDEIGYNVGYIVAKSYGLTDGLCTAWGLYNSIKMSTAAGIM